MLRIQVTNEPDNKRILVEAFRTSATGTPEMIDISQVEYDPRAADMAEGFPLCKALEAAAQRAKELVLLYGAK